jgi:SAM-dependent methyltransferase
VSGVSANWRRGHPWAAVYDFVVEREALSKPAGWLLFGTDTELLYERMRAVDDVPEGGAVLDIPCGGGVALRALEPGRRLRYVAADIAPAMLERTRQVAHQHGVDQVETRIADAEDMPFADGEFDLCMSFAGLHCFPHPDVAAAEIARCLRPDGGRFVGSVFLTDGGLRYQPMVVAGRVAGVMGPSGGMDDLERWLDDAGFADAQIERSGAIAYFDARR